MKYHETCLHWQIVDTGFTYMIVSKTYVEIYAVNITYNRIYQSDGK